MAGLIDLFNCFCYVWICNFRRVREHRNDRHCCNVSNHGRGIHDRSSHAREMRVRKHDRDHDRMPRVHADSRNRVQLAISNDARDKSVHRHRKLVLIRDVHRRCHRGEEIRRDKPESDMALARDMGLRA